MRTLPTLGCCCLFFLAVQAAVAAQTDFPSDTGMVNVKLAPYNAAGNGTTDDTTAIQNAIKDNVGKNRVLYFPTGTYLVSNTLTWQDAAGVWKCYLSLQGQNRSNTIIKLKNSCSGYGSPGTPKAVIMTASQNPLPGTTDGSGDEGFKNSITNMTIDTGTGNSGAIGVDYLASNQGALEEVTVQSGDGAGVSGVSMLRKYPGPCLIKNVTINGFNDGIAISRTEYSVTFENLTLSNQLVSGINNSSNVLSIRKITSTNSVPAIKDTSSSGLITVIDGTFTGGSSSVSAIENTGELYARNVTSTGYQSVIKNKGVVVSGSTQGEFVSSAVESLFSGPSSSLFFPIEETPTFHETNMSNWANVVSYGANPIGTGDDAAAIQDAIDSGATTVYLPSEVNGSYYIGTTIEIRGNVKKIVGFNTVVRAILNAYFQDENNPKPIFRFNGTNDVIIEGIQHGTQGGSPDGAIFFEHATNKTLTLRHIISGGGIKQPYLSTPGVGKLFLEDFSAGRLRFDHSQKVWARQLNPENTDGKIVNTGGQLWILGLKTEHPGNILTTESGGATELLGGLIYPVEAPPTSDIVFINNESMHTLVCAVSAYNSTANNFTNHVQETRNGVTSTLLRTDLPSRMTYGSFIPLFAGGYHYEAESVATVTSTDAVTLFADTLASCGQAEKLAANAAGDYAIYTLPYSGTGTYSVKVRYKAASTRGKMQLAIDGGAGYVNQGPEIDQYAASSTWIEVDLGTKTFNVSGNKQFKFTVTGKNASSSGYDLTFDYIKLVTAPVVPPSYTFEAEDIATAVASDTVTVVTDAAASGGELEKLSSNAVNDYIAYTIPLAQAGTYTVKVMVKKASTRGQFQMKIDGVNQGAVQDQYSASSAFVEFNLGTKTFTTAGDKEFRFTVTGQHANSLGFDLTFDYIKLEP